MAAQIASDYVYLGLLGPLAHYPGTAGWENAVKCNIYKKKYWTFCPNVTPVTPLSEGMEPPFPDSPSTPPTIIPRSDNA